VGIYRLGYCLAGQSDLRPSSERQAEGHHNQSPFFVNVENELDARSPDRPPEGFILKGDSMQDTMNKPAGLQSLEPTALSLEYERETREPVLTDYMYLCKSQMRNTIEGHLVFCLGLARSYGRACGHLASLSWRFQ